MIKHMGEELNKFVEMYYQLYLAVLYDINVDTNLDIIL